MSLSHLRQFCIIIHNYVGVTIVRDQFSVGSSAMVRCSSDNLAARMEWLNNEVVVASAISTQQLNLMFSPVNDSIHNQIYACRVTRDGEDGMTVTAVQSFTANVDGKNCLNAYSIIYCVSLFSQSLLLSSVPL